MLTDSRIVWHASTEMEAADIRSVWPNARIEVVDDQTGLPYAPLPPTVISDPITRIVYISRISPIKNLLLALQAIRMCVGQVNFHIYGPIEDEEYWRRCQEIIADMPPNVRVRYFGPLEAAAVRATFAEHDAFLFPSMGESFGHVIAESLSASCPVICSDQTPWTAVLAGGGGAALPMPTARSLSATIERITGMTHQERQSMRRKAGESYARWRSAASDKNILDHMRLRATSLKGSRAARAG